MPTGAASRTGAGGVRTATAALAACALLALAGCSGAGGPDRPTFDVPVQYPPGVSGDGQVDAYELLSNHSRRLEDRSVTVHSRVVQRYADDDTVRYRSTVTARYGESRLYVVRRVDGAAVPVFGGRSGRVELWSNRTTAVRAVTVNGTTTYRPTTPRRGVSRAGFGELFRLFSALEPTVDERRTRNGTTVYVLRAERSEVTGESPLGRGLAFYRLEEPRDVTFVVRVDEDGVVRSYDLSYVASVGNRTVRVTESVRFEAVGTTTVPRPSWVTAAVEEICSDPEATEWCSETAG